ncbi:MAG: hypothetical protein OXJ52_09830 [Oligoflexia bacterium]|nr:hypothetical protein [Oligoflexia bacterium]
MSSKKSFLKKHLLLILSLHVCSPMAFGITGSITDLGFSSEQAPKESFFGPLKGSAKIQLSRNLRRNNWENFFSANHKDSVFDTFLIKADLSLNYPLANSFPSLKNSPAFKETLVFLILSYKRPLYDVPQTIKRYCFQSHFCFEQTNIGISNSFHKKNSLTGQYSAYLTIPTSKKSYDQIKFVGIGASLNTHYPFFSKAGLQISGISSHFFDTAVYGSNFANAVGSESNDIFSMFNQAGLRFAYSEQSFIPATVIYISHLVGQDYQKDTFQGLSLGCSTVWSLGKRLRIVTGLRWGSSIFRHEYTARAKKADPFNADETFISGGLSYSF